MPAVGSSRSSSSGLLARPSRPPAGADRHTDRFFGRLRLAAEPDAKQGVRWSASRPLFPDTHVDSAEGAGLHTAVHAHQDILVTVMLAKSRMFWNVRCRAASPGRAGGTIRTPCRRRLALERDHPLGRAVDSGDHVEERGLACTVGTNHAGDAATPNGHVDVESTPRGRRIAWSPSCFKDDGRCPVPADWGARPALLVQSWLARSPTSCPSR